MIAWKKIAALFCFTVLTGCSGPLERAAAEAAEKNLTLDGWTLLGRIEVVNPDTAVPQGEFITGKFNYRSRRVAIPEHSTVPDTGYFKAVRSQSIFGIKEDIIEYDFTASSSESARNILEIMNDQQQKIIGTQGFNEK